MMKKFVMVLFSIVLVLGLNSCKKDYPDDIPKWLKKKVRQLERQTNFHRGNKYGGAQIIDEWTDGIEVIYILHLGIDFPVNRVVYDQDGNEQCNASHVAADFKGSCGEVNDLAAFHRTRLIWKEEFGW